MITPLHQGISVPDMDASIKWYSDVFGFTKLSDTFIKFLNARVVFLGLYGFQIELFQYMGADKKPVPPERLEPNEDIKTCGTKHVAYAVENMASLIEHFEEKGVDIVKPPFQMEGDTVCFIRDNSGVLIELIQVGS